MNRLRGGCALVVAQLAGAAVAQPAGVLVVNAAAAPGGNGQSWGTAFNDLQAALDAVAPAVSEIWVAAGTYTPTRAVTADPRTATFAMRSGLGIYGGFAGAEQARGERDPVAHVTTLRGGPVPVGSSNVYHVVTATGVDATAVLDGFTITGGNAARETAAGPDSDQRGGGLIADPGRPTLARLVITSNRAGSGGGVYVDGAAAIANCTISSNTVTGVNVYPGQWAPGRGGGLQLVNGGALVQVGITNNSAVSGGGAFITGPATLTNCQITSNHISSVPGAAVSNGGGVLVSGGPVFADCQISGNSGGAQTGGGGVYGTGSFTRCAISNNSADGGFGVWGGGTYTDCRLSGNSGGGTAWPLHFESAVLRRCVLSANGGGLSGVCIDGGSFEACTISGNTAYNGALTSGGPFVDCVLSGNQGSGIAGAAMFGAGPFINCTIAGNLAGPGRIVSGVITGCIVWGNASNAPTPYAGTINYSTMQGWDGSLGGTGNSGLDPLFVDPVGGDYRLQAASPCIDAGDNSALPRGVFCDIAGRGRYFDAPAPDTGRGSAPIVDRGAYEFSAPACCYANCDGSTDTPVLNINDFACFLDRFAAGHPTADCDASGSLNVLDFMCFLNAFAAGCP
jgi:hypothetical protein